MSLGEYAEHRKARSLPGQSKNAVSKAIKRGCLVKSVVRDHRGQPKIADPELADREWAAGTDHSRAPAAVKDLAGAPAAAAAPAVPLPPRPAAMPPAPDDIGADARGEPAIQSIGVESAREKHWKANDAEIKYRKMIGELVNADEMREAVADAFARCRARLSGLPTRLRQQIPHLTAEDIAVADSFVREALDELALKLEEEDEEDEAIDAA